MHIKDAIYVLDPKFSTAIGTYLVIKTDENVFKTNLGNEKNFLMRNRALKGYFKYSFNFVL